MGEEGGMAPTVWTDPLVPVRVDLTLDGHRIMDAFTWNLEEKDLTPESFASLWIREANLPRGFQQPIAVTIREQLKEYIPPIDPRVAGGDAGLPESRHVVRLDIRVGRIILRDQFEWDIHCVDNSPESFAAQLASDLGLSAEFVPQIAQAIRDQVLDLSEGVQSGTLSSTLVAATTVGDQRLREDGLPLVIERPEDVYRHALLQPSRAASEWDGPIVERLTVEELERIERKESREARLARRNRGKSWSGPLDASTMMGPNYAATGSRRRGGSVASGSDGETRMSRRGRRRAY